MKRSCCHLWKTVTTPVTEQQLRLIYGKRKSCLVRSWYSSQRVIHQQQTTTTTTTTDDKSNSSTSHSSSTTNTSSTTTITPSTSTATLATASASPTSAASPTAAAANTDLLRAAVLHSERPRVLFPWRHELDPLPRFLASSNQVDIGGRTGIPLMGVMPSPYGDWFMSLMTRTAAFSGFGLPLYKAFLENAWMDDLANSSAWAFSQAVTGVLSSAYHVSSSNTDDFPVNFDSNNNNNNNNNNHGNYDTGEFPDLSNMLDERLLKQYQAASEYGRDQIRVQLQMKPVMAQLDNMICVPFLTRAEVREHPELQHQVINLMSTIEFRDPRTHRIQNIMNIYRFLTDKSEELPLAQMERRGEPIMSSTIIAQVFVGCEEVFSVRDVHTDALLQGDVDGLARPVLHLVRLEKVVEYNVETKQWQPGQWIITDWDDLLDGNIWFL